MRYLKESRGTRDESQLKDGTPETLGLFEVVDGEGEGGFENLLSRRTSMKNYHPRKLVIGQSSRWVLTWSDISLVPVTYTCFTE